jgi:hypothetical protein
MVALTAVLQAGARLATFFFRQASASLPPGVTPEHFDMKSDRQDERMALCWSAVICAVAIFVKAVSVIATTTTTGMIVKPKRFIGKVMDFPLFSVLARSRQENKKQVQGACQKLQ